MMNSGQLLMKMPKWVELALVVLLAWLVAALFVSNTPSPTLMAEKTKGTQVAEALVDDTLLQNVNLFGQSRSVASKPVTQQPETTPVTESRLNIKLIGTVVAGDKSAAMVTVGGSKKQAVFFLNEEIEPNVKLIEVEPTEIVVSNRGKRERISIEAGKPLAKAAPVAAPRRAAPRSPIRTDVLNKRIDRNHLNSQMRNFSTLLSQARVSPHFTNGKPDGFKISEIVKGSLYEEIGLLNGDIIKAVNGESVTGAEQAMRMYRELQSATFIDVEVERNGTMQQISYVIQ